MPCRQYHSGRGNESAPAKVLAEEYGITYRVAHNRLTWLRSKGMLTRPAPGAAGGEITARAKAAIRRASGGHKGSLGARLQACDRLADALDTQPAGSDTRRSSE